MTWTAAASLVMLPLLRPSDPGNSSPVDVLVGLCMVTTAIWVARARLSVHFPTRCRSASWSRRRRSPGSPVRFQGLTLLTVLKLFQDLILLAWAGALVAVARIPSSLRLMLGAAWASTVAYATVTAVLLAVFRRGLPR